MPQPAQKQMPVSSVGSLVIRGAVSAGLRVLSSACTASNSAESMIGGTDISTISASGLRSRVFQNCVLNRWRPMSWAKNAHRRKTLIFLTSSPLRPGRTSRLLSCHRSVGVCAPKSCAVLRQTAIGQKPDKAFRRQIPRKFVAVDMPIRW